MFVCLLVHLLLDCLQRKSFDESKCSYYIDQLYACCFDFYKSQLPDSETGNGNGNRNGGSVDIGELAKNKSLKKTVSCPFPELLKLKIEQRMDDGNVDAKLLDVMKDKRRK